MTTRRFTRTRGAVAAGHAKTAEAGCAMLREGGNAFDAAVAAAFMTCVAEPSLTTICGGGFMMTHDGASRTSRLYDFFADMPGRGRRNIRSSDLDFRAVQLDFGGTTQEFHIGRGAAAVPGTVHGLLTVHRRLGRLPLATVLAPAIAAARSGVTITPMQAFVLSVVQGTVLATAGTRRLYAPQGHLLRTGETFWNPQLATVLEQLARDGSALFYRGDIAQAIAREIGDRGGLIGRRDLAAYRTIVRRPLRMHYRGTPLVTNPLPSMGGRLIALSLQLLEAAQFPHNLRPTDPDFITALVEVMWLTNHARAHYRHFTPSVVAHYRRWLRERRSTGGPIPADSQGYLDSPAVGNTTHISVIDEQHNAAAVTTSHGEGNGIAIPGTGIVLNNLLGEEDINPHGSHQWMPGTRLPSMMAPTILMRGGRPWMVLGSAGSNRLRTAIIQTIAKLLDTRATVAQAVNGPRLHWERGQLDIEPGFPQRTRRVLDQLASQRRYWPRKNLFFGGLQLILRERGSAHFAGAGDCRRGGVVRLVR